MKTNTKKNFLGLLKGAWEATLGERPRFFFFIALFAIANIINLAVPWAMGYTLNIFATLGGSSEAFSKGLLGILAYTGLRLLYALFHHSARYIQNRVAYSSRMNVMSKLFNALMRFPLRWHIETHSGENLSKLNRSVGAIEQMIGTYVWQMIECVVKVVFAGVAIIALDVWIATAVMSIALTTIALMVLFNRILTDRIRRNNIFYNKISRILVDYLFNIVTVKTLGVESSAKKHLKDQKPEGLRLSQRISSFMELKWGSVTMGSAVVISVSLFIYFNRYYSSHNKEPINLQEVYVLLAYLEQIFGAIGSFTGFYSGLIESSTAYEDAVKIIETSEALPERAANITVDNNWTSATIKKLNFSYVPGEKVGLNNVKFEFRRGEKIALVGPSGSGKSTLLKVFGGLLQPDSYLLSTDTQSSVVLEDYIQQCLLIPQ